MAWGWLKKLFGAVAPLAPIITTMFAPALTPVVTAAINAIILAEDKLGGGKGAEKVQQVAEYLAVAAPGLIASIEAATKKELVDQDLFEASLKDLAEALVKMLNAFRLLPKSN